MGIWDSYTKDAEKSTGGGDFPDVPDDLYDAMVQDVTDPRTGPDLFNPGKEKTDFIVKWELTSGGVPDGTTLWQYVTLPEQYLENGYLSDKSNLYKVMDALGFDLEGRFTVNPPEWQGMPARVMVENKPNKDGELRPKITAVKPARKTKIAAQEKRQPVGASAGRGAPLRERLGAPDDEE